MASILLHYIHVLLMYQVLCLVCIKHTNGRPSEQGQSCYPQGSVACKMWNYTNMDCSKRDLLCIPPLQHAASIQSLDLCYNELHDISDGAFSHLHELQHMDLSWNTISFLFDDVFNGLYELLTLVLNFNHISRIQAHIFSSLNKLQYLDLSNNHISAFHDDAFTGLYNLLTLDLGLNYISSLHDDAFTGLQNLLTLDLGSNSISFISDKTFGKLSKLSDLYLDGNYFGTLPGAPFQDLISLQTLKLSWQNLSSLSPSSLEGLENLQTLDLSFDDGSDNITGTPLAILSSLRELYMHIHSNSHDCDSIENLFTGLHNLQYLDISIGGSCLEIKFCSLYLENTHRLNTSHTCNRVIPLTYLAFRQADSSTLSLPAFGILNNLTSLYLELNDFNVAIQALNYLNSPLKNLTMIIWNKVYFDSTTFASWGNWKSSLKVLTLTVYEFEYEGAPFEWFTDLHVLEIHSLSVSVNAFNTLNNYTSLTMSDLSYNSRDFDFFWKQLCNITSLRKIDLSENEFDTLYGMYWSCSPPNLREMYLGYQTKRLAINANICQVATQLEVFDISTSGLNFGTNITCSNLVTLILSECSFNNYKGFYAKMPVLQDLVLSALRFSFVPDIPGVLNVFQAPKLNHMNLNSNQITVIDQNLFKFFPELTYLDLSNNKLKLISNMEKMSNLRTLLLNKNAIKIVPKAMLSHDHPDMTTLDLRENQFHCDCQVEAFRNWILTDNMVHLQNNYYMYNNYQCFSPDSEKDFSITQVNLDCKSHLWKYISIGIVCAIALLISVIMMVYYWWHIKYRLFLLFNRRRNQQHALVNNNDDEEHIDDDEDGIPRYDAYVPYHIEDEDWVDGELLRNIEEGEEPFRLCLRRRDIRAGRLLFAEVSLHMQRSRKILVILSPRFVEDNMCYFELNMGHHRVIEENRNAMIFIILEDIPDNKMTLLLRQLYCRVQCIKWPGDGYGQFLFWRRLREELKRPVPLDRRFAV
ncbi:uncharacterized protein [Amphiura filiformis]|uniref:uncharacterized protein n=1 Tax=Amphiura filiformis TaxID=82378 RepID=UPI003B21A8E4